MATSVKYWIKDVAGKLALMLPLEMRFRRVRYGYEIRHWYRRVIRKY